MGPADGLPGPTDAWITLAGLARETTRIRLGTLVTAATFRHPGPLAISVAQVDQMSGGRVEFGFGAGWFEAEHTAYGIPFPALGERFDRYEEQLEIITGLWGTPVGQTYSFSGKHYKLDRLARAAQARPGAAAADDHRRLAAEAHPGAGREVRRRVQRAVRRPGDRGRPVRPGRGGVLGDRPRPEGDRCARCALAWCVGRDDAEIGPARRRSAGTSAELRASGFAGTPAEVVDRIGQWRERTGISRVYLQLLDLSDLDHIDLFAAEVAPQLD